MIHFALDRTYRSELDPTGELTPVKSPSPPPTPQGVEGYGDLLEDEVSSDDINAPPASEPETEAEAEPPAEPEAAAAAAPAPVPAPTETDAE